MWCLVVSYRLYRVVLHGMRNDAIGGRSVCICVRACVCACLWLSSELYGQSLLRYYPTVMYSLLPVLSELALEPMAVAMCDFENYDSAVNERVIEWFE